MDVFDFIREHELSAVVHREVRGAATLKASSCCFSLQFLMWFSCLASQLSFFFFLFGDFLLRFAVM